MPLDSVLGEDHSGFVASYEDERRTLTWVHRSEQTVDAWERRHALGEVPSTWPYGLDSLREYAEVQVAHVADPSRVARLRHRLIHVAAQDDFALTWDENTAFRMQVADPHRYFAAGVIWMTDLVRRGASPRRLVDVLRHAASLWVLSEAQVIPLRDALGSTGPRVYAIPFGVDSDFFALAPYPTSPRIVSAGNDRDRDPATLFAAFAIVMHEVPEVEIFVQSRSELRPPEGVHVLPQMSHVALRELYASATLIVVATHPNLHGSGMTVALEGLSMGRPVICSDTPGMRQYVHDGEIGRLVRPGDVRGLAAAMIALLREPMAAAQMGRAGRAHIEHGFTTRTMAASLWEGPLQAATDGPSRGHHL